MKIRHGLLAMPLSLALVGCGPERPHVELSETANGVVADFSVLGEYPATVFRVRLSSDQGTVWDFENSDGAGQLWNLELVAGKNSASPVALREGTFEVAVPANRDSFSLEPDQPYRLQIWFASSDGEPDFEETIQVTANGS